MILGVIESKSSLIFAESYREILFLQQILHLARHLGTVRNLTLFFNPYWHLTSPCVSVFFIAKPLAYLHLSHIHPAAGELPKVVFYKIPRISIPQQTAHNPPFSLSVIGTVWGFGKHAYGNPFLFYILIFRSLLVWDCSKATWCFRTSLVILSPRPSNPTPPPAKTSTT